jgi:hypothetical protein
VRQREGRVPGQCLLEGPHRVTEILLGPPVPRLPPLQVQLIGLEVVGRTPDQRLGAAIQQADPQRTADRTGDLVLNREHVLRLAVEALGPEQETVLDVDELGGDPEPRPGPADAAFHHRRHLQAAADRARILGACLEREAGGARDHVEARDLRQGVDQFVGHPVGEVLVVG